jgi:hypothetical protein
MLVAFGDLDTYLVSGGSAIASPTLAALKEAVFQYTMAQIDPPLNAAALGDLAGRLTGVSRRWALPWFGSARRRSIPDRPASR